MAKLLIIGSGPAGVSAALYARRGGEAVTVVSKGTGALEKAESIENYYGLEAPVSGAELSRRGIAGAKALGVEFVGDEISGLGFSDDFRSFRAVSGEDVYEADSVIIAAGASRTAPPIPGLRGFEGKGVSYCATCDAFFYRGKTAAVLGAGDYAVHEAEALLPHAAKLLLLTNGEAPPKNIPDGVEVITKKLSKLTGEERLERVIFEDGSGEMTGGLFVAVGTAGSTELARKLGAIIEGTSIKVDPHMATNVPGLFAAGDCTGGLLQIAKAVYQGAAAGLSAVKYLRGKKSTG